MSESVKFDASDLIRGLKVAQVRVQAGAVHGLVAAAEHVLNVSNQHVPHETGVLERSGATSIDPTDLRAAVSYDTPYAVIQHEDLMFHHDPGRNAKYLENAKNTEQGKVNAIITQSIKGALS